jgi:hypothetical protein
MLTWDLSIPLPESVGVPLRILQCPFTYVGDDCDIVAPMFDACGNETLLLASTPVGEPFLDCFLFVCLLILS